MKILFYYVQLQWQVVYDYTLYKQRMVCLYPVCILNDNHVHRTSSLIWLFERETNYHFVIFSIRMIDFLKQEILEHELQTKRVSDVESGNL